MLPDDKWSLMRVPSSLALTRMDRNDVSPLLIDLSKAVWKESEARERDMSIICRNGPILYDSAIQYI